MFSCCFSHLVLPCLVSILVSLSVLLRVLGGTVKKRFAFSPTSSVFFVCVFVTCMFHYKGTCFLHHCENFELQIYPSHVYCFSTIVLPCNQRVNLNMIQSLILNNTHLVLVAYFSCASFKLQ